MADEFTKIVEMAQTLERLLQYRYGAQGRGLHEKITSVQYDLPRKAIRKMRFVATMRNRAAHEDVRIAKENFAAIKWNYEEAMRLLSAGPAPTRQGFPSTRQWFQWAAIGVGAILVLIILFIALR